MTILKHPFSDSSNALGFPFSSRRQSPFKGLIEFLITDDIASSGNMIENSYDILIRDIAIRVFINHFLETAKVYDLA